MKDCLGELRFRAFLNELDIQVFPYLVCECITLGRGIKIYIECGEFNVLLFVSELSENTPSFNDYYKWLNEVQDEKEL